MSYLRTVSLVETTRVGDLERRVKKSFLLLCRLLDSLVCFEHVLDVSFEH
jgi:hypothetical protein